MIVIIIILFGNYVCLYDLRDSENNLAIHPYQYALHLGSVMLYFYQASKLWWAFLYNKLYITEMWEYERDSCIYGYGGMSIPQFIYLTYHNSWVSSPSWCYTHFPDQPSTSDSATFRYWRTDYNTSFRSGHLRLESPPNHIWSMTCLQASPGLGLSCTLQYRH